MGSGRRWDERKGRDGPKWPAPAKIRGDRVQGWEMGEGGTNERAETGLNGRPPCQNKGWGREKWGEKKAETDLNGRPLPK